MRNYKAILLLGVCLHWPLLMRKKRIQKESASLQARLKDFREVPEPHSFAMLEKPINFIKWENFWGNKKKKTE